MNATPPATRWNRCLVLVLATLAWPGVWAQEPVSGYQYLRDEVRRLQDDPALNPGLRSVERGAEMFNGLEGRSGKTCASCHGEGGTGLDPKHIARYPVFDSLRGRPLTLQGRVHDCWTGRLGNDPLDYDGADALHLESFVRNLARGERVNVRIDGPMQRYYREGETIYRTRVGQLELACFLCHEGHVGQKIRGNVVSQGQSNAFPVYRLKYGRVNGLHTVFNEHFRLARAPQRPAGGADLVALEVYVAARGNGLPIETPGVRF